MPQKKKENLPRTHQISILLNDREKIVFDKYIKKYKIKNQSKFIRELIFKHILEQFDKDHPRLFPD